MNLVFREENDCRVYLFVKPAPTHTELVAGGCSSPILRPRRWGRGTRALLKPLTSKTSLHCPYESQEEHYVNLFGEHKFVLRMCCTLTIMTTSPPFTNFTF
ncbi:hypothetical protein RND81_01G157100 [Saponaria officinalis]|uniref:Uncharacterized protein n=1 Tax=Saponaria officinalis TaxID=3572 RepID=A0AAW1NEV3_SAPOF